MKTEMKTISIVTPCYNEEANVLELYGRVRAVMAGLGYVYEHIFIDNDSKDRTFEMLKAIACTDRNVKVIRNTRNFGHIRSPVHAIFQARGDAIVTISSDLQDPPELIPELIHHWERGLFVVIGVNNTSEESAIMSGLRTFYYRTVNRLSAIETYEHFTGFGLYDRAVVEKIKALNDPYPYFRGMIAEIGLPYIAVPYHKVQRKRGITKNNLYTLYDLAMLGITNLSKVPLRVVTFSGFVGSFLCIFISAVYFLYKLIFWTNFSVGIAPIVIGIFFFASVQLIFLGILGEYIGAIHTLVQNRPLVFERDRINFEYGAGEPLQGVVNRSLHKEAP
jgi:polyisoprenyl-phosphate glycosyltransferase